MTVITGAIIWRPAGKWRANGAGGRHCTMPSPLTLFTWPTWHLGAKLNKYSILALKELFWIQFKEAILGLLVALGIDLRFVKAVEK